MKTTTIALAATLLVPLSASAASNIGQCIYPKTAKQPGGLKFRQPVYIYETPQANANRKLLQSFEAFTVGAEARGGFVQLVGTPGFEAQPNPNAGQIVGWAKLSDFDFQALRNCN